MTAPRVLRWLLLADHVPEAGRGGGMVRYVVELAGALGRRDDVHLTVTSAPAASPFFTDLLGADSVRTVASMPTFARSLMDRYAGPLLEAGGPQDVVHGAKHLVPVRSRALRLLTVHDMLPFDRPQDFGRSKRLLLRQPYLASLRSAEALVCVSEATRARLGRQLPEAAARADVVPLAVSSALRTAVPEEVPELLGRAFAIVVGDSSPRKNVALVVDCWEEVVARVPGAVLALAGPPAWAASSHGSAFRRLQASGHVVVLGRTSDERLRWCYENAAVALCPSRLEGFGLPAVEATAFGAPLITSTDAALVEVSGDRALHLDPDAPRDWADAIVRTWAAGRRPLGTPTARSWDEVADETVAAVRRRWEG